MVEVVIPNDAASVLMATSWTGEGRHLSQTSSLAVVCKLCEVPLVGQATTASRQVVAATRDDTGLPGEGIGVVSEWGRESYLASTVISARTLA